MAARRRAKLSRSELAVAVGSARGDLPAEPLSRSNVLSAARNRVRQWEIGAEQPRPQVLPRLAEVLRVPVLSLLDVDPRRPTLAALRVAAGMSAAAMARRIGVPYATYSRLEQGLRAGAPDSELVDAISAAVGRRVDEVAAAISRSRGRVGH